MDKKIIIDHAVREIESVPEGSIINVNGRPKWYEFWVFFVYWKIRQTQKNTFGPKSRFGDTHTMVKFKNETIRRVLGFTEKAQEILKKYPNATTFSVEPPVATLIPTEKYALDDISVYQFKGREFDGRDTEFLLRGIEPILLHIYNLGELLDIMRNEMAGYPARRKSTIFSFPDKNSLVCSAGAAADYTYDRHEREKEGIQTPRLFSKLNEAAWTPEFVKRFYEECGGKWDIEMTQPACFANTDTHFNNEFELILKMNKGAVLFKK